MGRVLFGLLEDQGGTKNTFVLYVGGGRHFVLSRARKNGWPDCLGRYLLLNEVEGRSWGPWERAQIAARERFDEIEELLTA